MDGRVSDPCAHAVDRPEERFASLDRTLAALPAAPITLSLAHLWRALNSAA